MIKVNEFGHEVVTVQFETTKAMKDWILQFKQKYGFEEGEAIRSLLRDGLINSGVEYKES